MNTAMKKIVVFINIVMGTFSFAEGSKYAFSSAINSGFLYGTVYEIVYNKERSSQYLSELQWNIKPLWYVGLSGDYSLKDPYSNMGVFITVNTKIGLPGYTGSMEDRDWLTPALEPGSLSLFSSHDNKTKNAFLGDLEGGLSFPITSYFALKLNAGFSFMYFLFEARDGYLQYGANNHSPSNMNPYVPWQSNWPKTAVNGVGIEYTQYWFITKIGMDFLFTINIFSVNLSLSATPLINLLAYDKHSQRNPAFLITDRLNGGFYFEPKIDAYIKLYKNIQLGLLLAYRSIEDIRGDYTQDIFYPDSTVSSEAKDVSGAAYKMLNGSIILKLSL